MDRNGIFLQERKETKSRKIWNVGVVVDVLLRLKKLIIFFADSLERLPTFWCNSFGVCVSRHRCLCFSLKKETFRNYNETGETLLWVIFRTCSIKGSSQHVVYACVYRTKLCFQSTYLG